MWCLFLVAISLANVSVLMNFTRKIEIFPTFTKWKMNWVKTSRLKHTLWSEWTLWSTTSSGPSTRYFEIFFHISFYPISKVALLFRTSTIYAKKQSKVPKKVGLTLRLSKTKNTVKTKRVNTLESFQLENNSEFFWAFSNWFRNSRILKSEDQRIVISISKYLSSEINKKIFSSICF